MTIGTRKALGVHAESGMAAFTVTTVLVLVMSLIAIGFAFSVRQTARQSLDSQLSQQALETAEAGASMAGAIMRQRHESGASFASLPEKTDCAPDGTFPAVRFDAIDSEVTCLLVEKGTPTPTYSGVGDGSATVIPLTIESGAPLRSVIVTWTNTNSDSSTGCTDRDFNKTRPVVWGCGAGLLRIELAQLGSSTPNSQVVYAYPYAESLGHTNQVTVAMTGAGGWQWANARCNGTNCSLQIDSPTALNGYYMAVRSLYRQSNVSLNTPTNPTTGVRETFTSQAVIDVTARSADVLKRIRAHAPLTSSSSTGVPSFAIESEQSLCKRFEINTRYFGDRGCNP